MKLYKWETLETSLVTLDDRLGTISVHHRVISLAAT